MITRPVRVKAPKLERWTHGNYLGVRDSLDPSREDPRLAFLLRNVYPLQPDIGGGVVGRPGFAIMGAALGAEIQRIYQYTQLDGSEFTIIVAGGELWTYDWALDTATKRITTAQLGAAGIGLDTTGPVYAVTFADVVVFSDGTNPPFSWDGTAGAGLVELTNCPVLYGQPTIYFSKLFGIKAAERSTIVWSEENQPNVGYEAGGYNNAWTLGQTDQDQLFCLLGTNESLYYWRARSIGAIWGPVTSSFQSTGTHDAVSLKVGSTSPGSVVLYQDSVHFMDADGRPQRFPIGGPVLDNPGIWELCAETIKDTDVTQLEVVDSCYRADLDLIQFGVHTEGASLNRTLNFDAGTGRFVGYFDGFDFTTIDMVKDADGVATFVHGTTGGEAYFHGGSNGTMWDDELVAGATPIEHEIESSSFGYDPQIISHFIRADLSLRLDAPVGTFTLGFVTPSGRTASALNWNGAALPEWDIAVWDTDSWADADTAEFRLVVGINQHGRWMRLVLIHEAENEQFGLLGLTVTGARRGPNVDPG